MDPAPRHGHGLVLYPRRARAAQLRIKAMNAETVELAGIETNQILLMGNTNPPRRAANCRASICPIDKGLKLQAPSHKPPGGAGERDWSSKRATNCRCDIMSH